MTEATLQWQSGRFGPEVIEAYSDQLLVGHVLRRIDGTIYFDATVGVTMSRHVKDEQYYGEVPTFDDGKAAVERCWSIWCQKAGLVPPGWQPSDTAPMDGTWVLLRGRNGANFPMIPVVCAYVRREGRMAWRDSASMKNMNDLISDVPQGSSADWHPLP